MVIKLREVAVPKFEVEDRDLGLYTYDPFALLRKLDEADAETRESIGKTIDFMKKLFDIPNLSDSDAVALWREMNKFVEGLDSLKKNTPQPPT